MSLLFLYAVFAIGTSFLCSIMESVLLSSNLAYIKVLKKTSPSTGAMLEKIKTEINVSLSSILILNTIANTIGAAAVGAQAVEVFQAKEAMFYVSSILTLLILFFSEIIPKTIGALYWKELAPISTYIIRTFIILTYPLVLISISVTKIIVGKRQKSLITREELLETTLLGENEGAIDEHESDIIENALSLSKQKVVDILTPRTVVFAFDKTAKIKEVINRPGVQKFSRIPIYDGNIDNIVGIVRSKTMFYTFLSEKDKENYENLSMEDIMSDIFSISEKIPVSYALDLFIKRKEHLFVVTDNYGQTSGIVTLEDCVETLLGVEIMDEVDTTEDMQILAKERSKIRRKQNSKNNKLAQNA